MNPANHQFVDKTATEKQYIPNNKSAKTHTYTSDSCGGTTISLGDTTLKLLPNSLPTKNQGCLVLNPKHKPVQFETPTSARLRIWLTIFPKKNSAQGLPKIKNILLVPPWTTLAPRPPQYSFPPKTWRPPLVRIATYAQCRSEQSPHPPLLSSL